MDGLVGYPQIVDAMLQITSNLFSLQTHIGNKVCDQNLDGLYKCYEFVTIWISWIISYRVIVEF